MFFFQYLVQAGFFFVVPLFLSVASGCRRSRPAFGSCRSRSRCWPRRSGSRASSRTCRRGWLCASACSPVAGTVVLLGALDADAGPEIVFVPLLLIGLGIGALASQLGSVTSRPCPTTRAPEVGGLQNTMTNLGASIGTALAGSILIAC